MSFLVTRPPRPVPGTALTSTPCSAAIRATTGETNVLPSAPPSVGAGAGAAGAGAAACGAGAAGSGSGSGAAGASSFGSSVAGGAGGAEPAGPMTASFVPTSTVSPSGTRICSTTPDPGLGTSVSTLSVEISSSDSSAAISSPSFFSHLVIVPSDTETPICGMTTSIAVSVAIPSGHLLHRSCSPAAKRRSRKDAGSARSRRLRARLRTRRERTLQRPGECEMGRRGPPLILRQVAQAGDDVLDLREERLLEGRGERDRTVGSGDPLHRCVEIRDALLGDRRGDLPAEAAGARVLVQDEHLRG